VKKEAIELRDSTQETLAKEEIEEMNSSKKRDSIIKEYRCEQAEVPRLKDPCDRSTTSVLQ